MDVYVVQLENTVIGAAASLATAMEIADRDQGRDYGSWSNAKGIGWYRSTEALTQQRIIRVPLAGHVEEVPIEQTPFGRDWPRLMDRVLSDQRDKLYRLDRFADRAETAGHPVTYSWVDEPIIATRSAEDLTDRMRTILADIPEPTGPIRTGGGEALDWLRRGLDQMATYPSEKALPDSIAMQLMGINVVIDPKLPPNVLRFAGKIYVVDGEKVYETDEAHWPGLYFFGDGTVDSEIPNLGIFGRPS